MHPIRQIVTSIFLIILSPILIFPQTQTTGRITGKVRDAQGAVIVGAEVAVENPAIADKRTVRSDDAGNYSLAFLAPGDYEVKIDANGFTSALFRNVIVGFKPNRNSERGSANRKRYLRGPG